MMDKAVDPDSISYPVIYDGIDGLPLHGLPYRVHAVIVVVCQTGSLSIKVDGELVEDTPSAVGTRCSPTRFPPASRDI